MPAPDHFLRLLWLHHFWILACLALIALQGCAPNNFSYTSTHSLLLQGESMRGSAGGIGYDGPKRLTIEEVRIDTMVARAGNKVLVGYVTRSAAGNGPMLTTLNSFANSAGDGFFMSATLPLWIGQIPTAELGYGYGRFAVHGIARSAILQNGLDAGLTLRTVDRLVLGVGSEYRQDYARVPKDGEIIYGGLFGAEEGFVWRPTIQASWAGQWSMMRMGVGIVHALSNERDLQISLRLMFVSR